MPTPSLDIRARVYCSLGTVISGNFADTYAQGSGLIFTRGSVEIQGIVKPDVGTIVQFAFSRDGYIARLPRTLRVLSSFADPFRQLTTVQLGCLLTFLENRKPPVENPNSKNENNVPCYVYEKATLPISAKYIVEQILSSLDVSTEAVPLTNVFSVEEFDLTAGFIQVLSDLIVSEGYIAYLDEQEILRYKNLNAEVGIGPIVDSSKIVDLSPIGVGNLPGDSVIVNYSSRRLKPPSELTNNERAKRNWEYEETFGASKTVSITYTPTGQAEQVTQSASYNPYNFTATVYDGWDRAVERLSYERSSIAEVNNRWAADRYKNNLGNFTAPAGRMEYTKWNYVLPGPPSTATEAIPDLKDKFWSTGADGVKSALNSAATADINSASTCIADPPAGYETLVSTQTETYISEAELAGTLNVDTYEYDNLGTQVISFDTAYTKIESVTVVTFEKDASSGITKTKTEQYLIYGKTTTGQQDLAARINNPPDITGILYENWIMNLLVGAASLRSDNVEVSIRTEREFGLQRRPSQQDRNNSANAKPEITDQKAEVKWITGSTESTNYIEFNLPYAPDDKISWSIGSGYTSTPSDAGIKALSFGRIQNRLLLGNRNGISLQLPVALMPPRPFDPLYVVAGGLTGQYRVNAATYSFDSSGIVASADCLFWGGTGEEP